MLSVRYVNTRRDFLAFSIYHYMRSPWSIAFLTIIFMIIFRSIYSAYPKNASIIEKLFIFIVVLLLYMAYMALLLCGSIILSLFSRKNKTILAEHTVTLKDDGFIEETIYNSTVHKWAAVQQLRRSKYFIYIYVAANMAHIVPKRAFATETEWDDFWRFCKEKSANVQ